MCLKLEGAVGRSCPVVIGGDVSGTGVGFPGLVGPPGPPSGTYRNTSFRCK